LFYGPRGSIPPEARAVCAGCSVRVECLLFSLVRHEWEGLWGGMSAKQRRALGTKGRAALVDQADPRVVASLTTPVPPPGWRTGSVTVRLTPRPKPKPAPKPPRKPDPALAAWRFMVAAGAALIAAERNGTHPR
jgi:hypothetical protein